MSAEISHSGDLAVRAAVIRSAGDPGRQTDLRAELLALRDELTRMLTGPCVPSTTWSVVLPKFDAPFSGKPAPKTKAKPKAKGKR